MVATTSYRRNGMIVGDAIADLDALRAYIVTAYGELDRVILEGESMGGLIVTIMAERDAELYSRRGRVRRDPVREGGQRDGRPLAPAEDPPHLPRDPARGRRRPGAT